MCVCLFVCLFVLYCFVFSGRHYQTVSPSMFCCVRFYLSGPLWAALTRVASNRSLVVISGLVTSTGIICVSLSRSPVHLGCSMALFSKFSSDFKHPTLKMDVMSLPLIC